MKVTKLKVEVLETDWVPFWWGPSSLFADDGVLTARETDRQADRKEEENHLCLPYRCTCNMYIACINTSIIYIYTSLIPNYPQRLPQIPSQWVIVSTQDFVGTQTLSPRTAAGVSVSAASFCFPILFALRSTSPGRLCPARNGVSAQPRIQSGTACSPGGRWSRIWGKAPDWNVIFFGFPLITCHLVHGTFYPFQIRGLMQRTVCPEDGLLLSH